MYRTVESSFWSDPKVRALSPQAKLLFLYLITNDRSHVSGIYYLPKASISHETGYPINTLSKVVSELIASRTIAVDEERDVFWVKKMFRYQGRGKKNNASAYKQLTTLHNSPLIKEFCKAYPAIKSPPIDTLSDTVSEVGRHSSLEQDQDQEQEQNNKTPPKSPKGELLFPVPLGTCLDVPEFKVAWSAWQQHRIEIKKRLTPTSANQQLDRLTKLGAARAVAAIKHTIAQGWVGIREEVGPGGKLAPPPKSEVGYWLNQPKGAKA